MPSRDVPIQVKIGAGLRLLLPTVTSLLALSSHSVRGDEPTVPGAGWQSDRYQVLWTKSPFAVATPEAGPETTEFSLWGIAQIDGVSYASVTNKQTSEHFLLTSDKPEHGLTLVSVARGADTASTTAVVQKDGVSMTLKVEQAPAVAMNIPQAPPPPGPGPGNPNQQISGARPPDFPPPPPRVRPRMTRPHIVTPPVQVPPAPPQ